MEFDRPACSSQREYATALPRRAFPIGYDGLDRPSGQRYTRASTVFF